VAHANGRERRDSGFRSPFSVCQLTFEFHCSKAEGDIRHLDHNSSTHILCLSAFWPHKKTDSTKGTKCKLQKLEGCELRQQSLTTLQYTLPVKNHKRRTYNTCWSLKLKRDQRAIHVASKNSQKTHKKNCNESTNSST